MSEYESDVLDDWVCDNCKEKTKHLLILEERLVKEHIFDRV